MAIFRKPVLKTLVSKNRDIPEGLWTKCPSCGEVVHNLALEENLRICPKCDHHFPLVSSVRIASLVDEGTFEETAANLVAVDTLKFKGVATYEDRLKSYREKTGLKDAVLTGTAKIDGRPVSIAVMDFTFLAATMGSVVGEKITRAIELATRKKMPVIIVCASGGARMYEGMLSLMQMAKTSGALARHAQAKLPYISVLTNPTTAGVMASFASLGDVILAEPKSMIGFAGPRVIKETTHQDLPPGFQTAEFLEKHGLVDHIVHRAKMRDLLAQLLGYFAAGGKVNFSEALAWLYSTQQFGIKLGLENTHRLLAAAGHPEAGCHFLHVAGTNGKGSVCAMLDSILRAAGRRTGLYTSPHLVNFRERVRVNGEMIPEAAVAHILTDLRDATREWPHAPTFFELATVLALRHFADAGVDYVVLETGMGGRLDSTNAVEPMVSVITPIAMDHAQWLGDTLEQIAREKAGILKPGVPAVSAPQEAIAADVLQARAGEIAAPLRVISEPTTLPVNLRGTHQRRNASLAVAALHDAGIAVSDEAIRTGLATVQWPARFQEIGRFVLDGAHNPHGSAQLVATWSEVFGGERAIVIFGALRDKDYSEMLIALAPLAIAFWFVPLESVRGEAPGRLAEGCPFPHRLFTDLGEAMAEAARQPMRSLVTGSLFLVGEALEILGAA